jgi:hypothetical protein
MNLCVLPTHAYDKLRPLARAEQVASVGQVTELTLTGRSWTKGSTYGGPVSALGAWR